MAIDLEKLLLAAQTSAYMAGDNILDLKESFDIDFKGKEKEIVTTADIAANEIIQIRLIEALPEAGWLSEETKDNPSRLSKELVWLVDPLDGTKYFASGSDQYTVSIALVQNGSPIIGVIYQPAKRLMFYAMQGKGAYVNNDPIHVSTTDDLEKSVLITSDRVKSKEGYIETFGAIPHRREVIVGGTALRLARMAKGDADMYLSMGNSEWGIAAGDILVKEAGGKATDKEGNPLKYNKPDAYIVPLVISNGILHRDLPKYKAQP